MPCPGGTPTGRDSLPRLARFADQCRHGRDPVQDRRSQNSPDCVNHHYQGNGTRQAVLIRASWVRRPALRPCHHWDGTRMRWRCCGLLRLGRLEAWRFARFWVIHCRGREGGSLVAATLHLGKTLRLVVTCTTFERGSVRILGTRGALGVRMCTSFFFYPSPSPPGFPSLPSRRESFPSCLCVWTRAELGRKSPCLIHT